MHGGRGHVRTRRARHVGPDRVRTRDLSAARTGPALHTLRNARLPRSTTIGFFALVPALPEIVTEGETEEEALAMAEDAICLVLDDRAARGEEIPENSAVRIREVIESAYCGRPGACPARPHGDQHSSL